MSATGYTEKPEQQALIPEAVAKPSPKSLIELAVAQGANAEAIGKLWEIQKQWEANEARKQFEEAFALFKRNVPDILKTKHVKFANRDGSITEYHHARLDELTQTVGDALRAVGITMTWDASTEGSVTCVLSGFGHTHRGATLSSPPDKSGGKNDVQAIGSRTSYLMRYTALMTIGEVPKDAIPDDDGRTTEGLTETAVIEFCDTMKDAMSMDELRARFDEAWKAAKAANDLEAQKRFMVVKEQRKKDIREMAQ